MSIIDNVIKTPGRIRWGFETPIDSAYRLILIFWEVIRHPYYIFSKKTSSPTIHARHKFIFRKYMKYFDGKIFNFNGIKLPDFRADKDICYSFYQVYEDCFFVYLNYKDDYSSNMMNKMDKYMLEGPYCYNDHKSADITIKKGDVVIDVGAWIGDFSAYASAKGAKVYAFEPDPTNLKWLKKTVKLNKNIIPIPLGLGNKEEKIGFISRSGGSRVDKYSNKNKINITTLDNFAKKSKLDKIDFIKADIEGFERNMLMGASKVLKKYEPKLSICTYHLPDDPKVLARIIKKANPKYKIIQMRHKLYAYVPKQ